MSQIVRLSLADEIRNRLREQILSGVLVAGERLTEQRIAQQFGTSQGPVREAFASLCQEGVLISLPHRGTFVATVSESEARMAYQIRTRIEPYAAELAMPRATPEVYDQLEDAVQRMLAAAKRNDMAAHTQADMGFHGLMYELAGSELLKSLWTSLSTTIRQFIVLVAPHYVLDLNETAEQHIVLLGLFRSRDLDALSVAIPTHVGDLWRRIQAAKGEPDPDGDDADR